MKHPDTHFGHLSLHALPLQSFDGALGEGWLLEVDEAVTCKKIIFCFCCSLLFFVLIFFFFIQVFFCVLRVGEVVGILFLFF